MFSVDYMHVRFSASYSFLYVMGVPPEIVYPISIVMINVLHRRKWSELGLQYIACGVKAVHVQQRADEYANLLVLV